MESLTPRPGIREQIRPEADITQKQKKAGLLRPFQTQIECVALGGCLNRLRTLAAFCEKTDQSEASRE